MLVDPKALLFSPLWNIFENQYHHRANIEQFLTFIKSVNNTIVMYSNIMLHHFGGDVTFENRDL